MKIRIIKDILLARPDVSMAHWNFKAGNEFESNDEYLTGRLLELGNAVEVKAEKKAEKAAAAPKKNKVQPKPKNKSVD